MRIAFDVSTCAKRQPGGIANYGRGLVQACVRVGREHDFVLALRGHRWSKRRFVRDLAPGAPLRLLGDLLPGAGLGRVDVLHAIGVRLPPRGRFARVVTLHDLNVFEFPELSEPVWRHKRRARIAQTVARADLVVAYTEQGAKALVEHVGLDRERVHVVGMGIDVEQFRPQRAEEIGAALAPFGLDGRPYLVSVGLGGPRKNHAGLLEAFARAALGRDWLLVLAGSEGPAAEEIRARAHALGIAEQVRLPGWIPSPRLPALLAGSRGYVCASLHEGFGIPVAEAQACGVPVASSDRGGLPEVVGDAGLLFDPQDEHAFTRALQRLAGEPELAAELGRRGRERALRSFSWDAVAARMLEVHRVAAALRRAG